MTLTILLETSTKNPSKYFKDNYSQRFVLLVQAFNDDITEDNKDDSNHTPNGI